MIELSNEQTMASTAKREMGPQQTPAFDVIA
jgi:hypothetical protein